jgi:hypothetical protein
LIKSVRQNTVTWKSWFSTCLRAKLIGQRSKEVVVLLQTGFHCLGIQVAHRYRFPIAYYLLPANRNLVANFLMGNVQNCQVDRNFPCFATFVSQPKISIQTHTH